MATSRRTFIGLVSTLMLTAPLVWLLKSKYIVDRPKKWIGSMLGPSYKRGHNLFKMLFSIPKETQQVETVIVGGGVSGLSTARTFVKNNYHNFVLLELEDSIGGNSRSHQNKTSSFPLGAHYLPIPAPEQKELIELLRDFGLITHFDSNGLPFYAEEHLCHDPEERLFINGHWQEGLIPHFGVPEADIKEINQFLQLMQNFKNNKGSDHKYAFEIPIDASSSDEKYKSLDQLSMLEFLHQHNLKSTYLHGYVEYCCKDDYGTLLHETSAWAGIHYFASRRGQAANATGEPVLTWPEGNHWLSRKIAEPVKEHIRTGCMVFAVTQTKQNTYWVDYIDYSHNNTVKRIEANKVVFSCPQFVCKHIKTNVEALKERDFAAFHYSSWVTGNAEVSTHQLNERNGAPLSWDNVIFNSKSLGYIHSSNQSLKRLKPTANFTWYYLLPASYSRKRALQTPHEQWAQLLLDDLKKVYSQIDNHVLSIDICVWGHAMIQPKVGFMWGNARKKAAESINNSLYFTHTDISGISIFEEGFYRGHNTALQILKTQHHV